MSGALSVASNLINLQPGKTKFLQQPISPKRKENCFYFRIKGTTDDVASEKEIKVVCPHPSHGVFSNTNKQKNHVFTCCETQKLSSWKIHPRKWPICKQYPRVLQRGCSGLFCCWWILGFSGIAVLDFRFTLVVIGYLLHIQTNVYSSLTLVGLFLFVFIAHLICYIN